MVKAIAKKKDTAVAVSDVDRGIGSNVGSEDLLLPRIDLLQALSPSVVSEGAKAGTMVNNITKEVYGNEINIIPIFLTKTWIRWRARAEGGGMVWRSNDPSDQRVIEESKWNGAEKPLATAYLNFLCMVEGEDLPIVASFANTSYAAGRKMFTLAKMTPGPIHGCKYKLKSTLRTNNLGSFYVYNVDKIGPASAEETDKATELYTMFAGKDMNFEAETTDKPDTEGLGDEF